MMLDAFDLPLRLSVQYFIGLHWYLWAFKKKWHETNWTFEHFLEGQAVYFLKKASGGEGDLRAELCGYRDTYDDLMKASFQFWCIWQKHFENKRWINVLQVRVYSFEFDGQNYSVES